ncbi:UNVERIFIED_CONTAM: hypothetical protein RCG69_18920, partial [Kocuria sp. CPCC 205293]
NHTRGGTALGPISLVPCRANAYILNALPWDEVSLFSKTRKHKQLIAPQVTSNKGNLYYLSLLWITHDVRSGSLNKYMDSVTLRIKKARKGKIMKDGDKEKSDDKEKSGDKEKRWRQREKMATKTNDE